jgi:cellulose synthase/poly-beta-1,6-N-acetylglucosamine synthase-like glycosyltransferase
VSKGRNAGARAAKGDILLFVDADTVLFFNALTEIEKELIKDDVVAVACPIIPISPLAKDFMLYWAFNQFVKASIKRKKAQISGMCFACRKKAFEGVGGYAEHLERGEDFDLSARLSKIGKIKYTENTFALTSPRRIVRWGRLNGAKKIIKLYLNYLITKKRATIDDWEDIR